MKKLSIKQGVLILKNTVLVSKAKRLAEEINTMIEKEFCCVCDKPLHGADMVHDDCYSKEWKERGDERRHPDA